MNGAHRPIPFRWILPVVQSVVCIAILWPLRGELVSSVRSSTHAYQLRDGSAQNSKVKVRALYPDLLPDFSNLSVVIEERQYRDRFVRLRLWVPALLNLPAAWLDLPRAIVTGDKNEWVPTGMYFQYWRALAWPLIGIGLWWLAGRGIEALIAASRGVVRPSLTYLETAIAILFALVGIVLFVGAILDPSSLDDDVPRTCFIAAGAMWFLLGTATITARFSQWRLRRRRAPQSAEDPATP